MSNDDRTDIPTLRRAVNKLASDANAELNFQPGDYHQRVKARFYRRLEELAHHYDKETVFNDSKLVVQLAGTERVLKWLEQPGFASWFVDEDYIADTITGLQENAISVIKDVLRDGEAHDSDKLKAARMLLELGDQFPGRKSEVRFLDDRLNDLTESQVEKEIQQLEADLANLDSDAITDGGSDEDG